MTIDDKSPIVRINLNFPASSGTFRQVSAALYLPFLTTGSGPEKSG